MSIPVYIQTVWIIRLRTSQHVRICIVNCCVTAFVVEKEISSTSAKITVSKNANGPMAVTESSPDGRSIKLENTGKKVHQIDATNGKTLQLALKAPAFNWLCYASR